MIVLDTNVLSELMRANPDETVRSWVAAATPEGLFTTAVTRAEILFGLALLPVGRRRSDLSAAANRMFSVVFSDRVLPFDSAAAEEYAFIASGTQKSGRMVQQFDVQIAAIVRAHRAGLATRNIKDFVDTGIQLINPWETNPG